MTASTTVIETAGLVKKFGSYRAVNEIDLAVPSGAVYGFLGPNGSGKTTTIRMLLGLISPNAGTVTVLGQPMPDASQQVLTRVGALVEGPAFYPYLTGAANLARLQAVDRTTVSSGAQKRAAEALERVGLTAAAGKKFRHYSLGMKQRLGLAAALLRHRDLLILDEPMNGLDPQGTREVRSLIRELNADGTTVLVSSHLLSEVEQTCTHVGIMSKGKLLRQSNLDDLQAETAMDVHIQVTPETVDTAMETLRGLGLGKAELTGHASLSVTLGEHKPQEVSAALVLGGVGLVGFEARHRSLEEMFVDLTGAGFDVAH